MTRDLRHAALRGTFWSAVQQMGDKGIQLPVLLVLARLLPPESFGLVALAVAYVEFVQLFLNQGLTAAIVQRDKLQREHLDSAFWGNIVFGALLGGASFVSAGSIAALLGEAELDSIVRWLSISFLLTALSAVQGAILRRGLQFKMLAVRSISGQMTAGVVAIVLALSGFGVWSLVGMQLVNPAVGVFLLWKASDWRPRFSFSYRHYRELLAFGVSIMGVQILAFLRRRADTFLIGSFLGAAALGYYSIARQLINGVSALLTGSVVPVAWSMLSRLQKDPVRLAKAIYQATALLALVTWPAFLGIAAIAPEFVPTLMGSRWLPSVPILQAFAIAEVVVSISGLNFTAITAMGNTGWRVGLEALVAIVTLVAIVVALPYGIVTVAWAYAASYYLLLPFQLWAVVRLLPITTWAYLRQHLPAVLCAVPMVGAIFGLRSLPLDRLDGPILLAVLVILGVFVYCSALFLAVPATARQAVSTFRLAFENARDRDEIGYESMLG